MDRGEVLARIRALKTELRLIGLHKLYLFGSLARDEASAADVDLLYDVADGQTLDFFRLCDAIDRLEAQLDRPVDLVERELLHRRIRPRVEAEMIEIY